MTEKLVELLGARPGERVLEVGTGLGEVGAAVARRVAPGGEVLLTDVSPGMLAAAQTRLGELPNGSFAIADATALQFEDGAFDRAVARFALMLIPQPAEAFAELRRVLRDGGRLAFAVWTSAPENQWGSAIGHTLLRLGLVDPPEPDSPGPFRLADPERIRSLLAGSGFREVALEPVAISMRYDSLEHYWEVTQDLSFSLRTALVGLSAADAEHLRDEVTASLAQYAGDEGVAIPGRAWVAAADAI